MDTIAVALLVVSPILSWALSIGLVMMLDKRNNGNAKVQ